MSDPKRLISFEEARRAYYIDFEGSKDGPPALLGWLYAEGKQASEDRVVLQHDVLLQDLFGTVGHEVVAGKWEHRQSSRSLGVAVNDFVRRAEKQNRLIVSWSQHELNQIAAAELSPKLLRWFQTHYRDGKATAKQWRAVCKSDVVVSRDGTGGAHKLVKYMELTGYQLPDSYSLKTTSTKITQVRRALAKVGSFEDLDERMKGNWADVLLHNAVDVDALRHIVIRASLDLELAEQ